MEEEMRRIINEVWPEWQIEKTLGYGSYGTVFQAVRKDFTGTFRAAIKVVVFSKDDEEIAAEIKAGYTNEEILASIQDEIHEYTSEIDLLNRVKGYTNITTVDDHKVVQSDNDSMTWYILIRTELLNKIDYRSMKEAEVIQLGIDICTALDVCREKSIVHRDIKPENIMMNDMGNYKLGDFGIARNLDKAKSSLSIKGTPNYIAPEVHKAKIKSNDINEIAKADIYSLGMVLYWICNGGKAPFIPNKQIASYKDKEDAFNRRINGEQLPGLPGISDELQQIILKACSYEPNDRYSSSAEMREALLALNGYGKPDTKRNLAIVAWMVLLLIIVGVLVAIFSSSKPEASAAMPTMKSDTYHVTLKATEGFTPRNFFDAVSILRGRLDVLTDNYQMIENQDTIDLYLPTNSFGQLTIDKVFDCYISRAAKLYLSTHGDFAHHYIPVTQKDLESVTLLTGTIPGIDASDYGVNTVPYQYFMISLNDEFVNTYRKEYESWNNCVFAQDVEEFSRWYYTNTFSAGDGKHFYLLNHDISGKFNELALYNMTHNSLASSFEYIIDINSYTTWEMPRRTTISKGKHQCSPYDFAEPTITLSMKSSYHKLTEGEWTDTRNGLITRLDALGMPYALGRNESDDSIVIKTLPDHICDEVIALLFWHSSSCYIRTENYEYPFDSGLQWDKGGNLIIKKARISPYTITQFEAMANIAKKGNDKLYMVLDSYPNNMPILMLDPDEALNDVSCTIKEYCILKDGFIDSLAITEDNKWYGDLFIAVLETRDLMNISFERDKWQYNPDADGNILDQKYLAHEFMFTYNLLRKTIKDAVADPNAIVNYDCGNLEISISLEVSENFLDKAEKLIKHMFSAFDWKHRYIDKIVVNIKDRINAINNVSFIFYREDYDSIYSNSTPEIKERYFKQIYGYGSGELRQYIQTMETDMNDPAFFESTELFEIDNESSVNTTSSIPPFQTIAPTASYTSSSQATPLPTPTSSAIVIPVLTEKVDPYITNYSVLMNDSFGAYSGPGTEYVEQTLIKENCDSPEIKMYFIENGYIATSLYYKDLAQRLWTYIPIKFIEKDARNRVEDLPEVTGYVGTINQKTYPVWSPDVDNPKKCDWYCLQEGTNVTVYLTEKDYALAEFTSTSDIPNKSGKVRMWIPINSISF